MRATTTVQLPGQVLVEAGVVAQVGVEEEMVDILEVGA